MSFANQKQIVIHKLPCDSSHTYSLFNLYSLQFAMMNLKNSSFKLWAYLASNQNGYKFYLSAAECANWGIKVDAYHSAVRDLIAKGFLVKNQSKKAEYAFFEIPQKVLKEQIKESGYLGFST